MFIRILLIPIYIIVLLLSVILNLVLRLSAWVFYVLAGLFMIVTVCCYYMQIETGDELRRMLICCGVLFILPQAAEMLSAVLTVSAEIIGDRIRK